MLLVFVVGLCVHTSVAVFKGYYSYRLLPTHFALSNNVVISIPIGVSSRVHSWQVLLQQSLRYHNVFPNPLGSGAIRISEKFGLAWGRQTYAMITYLLCYR